ncbi:MAG: hypothetical protein LLG42_05005, partial [Chloroflexi bacterium]|nr:hypothetical protein [Chloroflexota bacterium]
AYHTMFNDNDQCGLIRWKLAIYDIVIHHIMVPVEYWQMIFFALTWTFSSPDNVFKNRRSN